MLEIGSLLPGFGSNATAIRIVLSVNTSRITVKQTGFTVMASIQLRGSRWQLRVKHRLLGKPFFHTFDTETEARSYGEHLEALLSRGIVPSELLEPEPARDNPVFASVLADYLRLGSPAPTDIALLTLLHRQLGSVRVRDITSQWVEHYVTKLKIEDNLAPGTIRKRVESLGRVMAWHLLRSTSDGSHPPANPFRLMPRGYSLYTEHDKTSLAESGKESKIDQIRDRRLSSEEESSIRRALAGEKRQDRERGLVPDANFSALFDLILNTGIRLSEAYRLRAGMIDLTRWVISVEGSKGHRGKLKPRVVPVVHALRGLLTDLVSGKQPSDLLFPFWDGTEEGKVKASGKLSRRFATLFDYAGVIDFTEHDLRHEATCRWFSMRDARGAWVFSDIEICRIMGWTDTRMALRYASLRGEDLSSRLG